jgi:phosphate transport system substrate-binding protein
MYRALSLVLVPLLACNRSSNPADAPGQEPQEVVTLLGAGSTFDHPLFWRWFAEYRKKHPRVISNYEAIGSGAGITAIIGKTVDFAASDAPMTEAELKKAPGIVHIPVTCGAVVPVFNLPGIDKLRLTPETLAGAFLGRITRWSDPALAKENSGVKLPDLPITIVHRADSSGTTAILTDYLSKASPEWRSGPGAGKSVNWPVGMGGRGNETVTTILQATVGALGYVELAYVIANKLSAASLLNREGEFVDPTIQSVSAAAEQANIPDDFRVSITDAPGKQTWPIAGFSWVLVYEDQPDPVKGTALLRMLWWGIHEGQEYGPTLGYVPLTPALVRRIEQRLKKTMVQGKPALANVQ